MRANAAIGSAVTTSLKLVAYEDNRYNMIELSAVAPLRDRSAGIVVHERRLSPPRHRGLDLGAVDRGDRLDRVSINQSFGLLSVVVDGYPKEPAIMETEDHLLH